jgi:hypothetical protein
MSLRNLYQDNLKSWADIKCDTIENNAGEIAGQEEGLFSSVWSGAIPNTAADVRYVKEGDWITLNFNQFIATANSADVITADTVLPAELRPGGSEYFPVRVDDNGTPAFGLLEITGAGNMIVSADATGANFAGAGNTGLYEFCCRYLRSLGP